MFQRYLVAVLMPVAMFQASTARAASITFESQNVLPGQSFEIAVFGLNLVDVYAFGFDLAFDPAVIAFVDATEGDFLNKDNTPTFFFVCPDATVCPPPDFNPPSVSATRLGDVSGASTESPQTPELLATLLFTAVAAGNAGFQLNPTLLRFVGPELSDFESIPFELDAGTITAVPEPSTLGLLGIGLAAMARKRLRRHSQTSA